eukprot:Skav229351  [mRNA]  locus=scaffold2596:517304:519570:- [translate_table: standard]
MKRCCIPVRFLIRPQNRAGKMCLPAEMHSKGDKLLKTGADLSTLDGICFEVASDPQKMEWSVASQPRLQEQSEGKLAKIIGNERYLSVSGSHTVAFVKSVSEQCVTEEPGLLELCPDGEDGMDLEIIKQEVEVQFPDLPALVQQAQNSSHALVSQMNEVEAAMQIAYWFKQCQSMPEAVKLTMASQPACAHYLDCIGRYVRLFGCGSDFPIISVLGWCLDLGKLYGVNSIIAEEVMEHLTALDWEDSEKSFVWVRAGCVAANCTSTKAVDGISRLLVKADLDKLKHLSRREDIKKAEKLCSLAWETLSKAQLRKNKIGLTVLGRLLVRIVLVLTSPEKVGKRLMLPFVFMEHIHRLCVLLEASSRAHITKEKYQLELTKYYHRKQDPADKVWQLMPVGDEAVLFEHQPFWGDRQSALVPFAELKDWKLCTLDVAPRLFPQQMIIDLLQRAKYHFEAELERAQVQAAVAKLFLETEMPELRMEKKSGLYTKKQYNKDTLRLVPVGMVQKHLSNKVGKNCATVQCGSSVCIVKALSMGEKEHAKNMLCPFFHVHETEEDSEVNMEKSTVKFEGYITPILKNKKQLAACAPIKIESSAGAEEEAKTLTS